MKANSRRQDKAITQRSDAYIEAWQKRRESRESRIVTFRSIPPASRFTLPGGLVRLTKLNPRGAQTDNGQLVGFYPWEEVAPV